MAITADITGNPYKITGTTATASKVTDEPVMIQAIVWYKGTTNGHLLSITDKAGNVIWKEAINLQSLNRNNSITFPSGLYSSDGIYIDDMDSGEVYIYVQ